jgi:hypothetical protein
VLVDSAVHIGDLTIDDATELATVRSLSRVTGNLRVFSLPDGASDLSFLSCLREVEGLLEISQEDITSLEGLDRLERFGRLNVHNSTNLRSLDGLTSLRHAGNIWVVANDRLTSLGLDQVETADVICGNEGSAQDWDEDDTSDPCYCGPAGE